MDKPRYVYHYCATYQASCGGTGFCDGVLLRIGAAVNMSDYRGIKNHIKKANEINSQITLTSLCFLHMENEND